MALTDVCGVEVCPALAIGADGFCSVHAGAKRAGGIMAGTRCPRCTRVVEPGDWITRESTAGAMVHAACLPKRPYAGRKVDRAKPFLEGNT